MVTHLQESVCSHILNAKSKLVKMNRLFSYWYGSDTIFFPWQRDREMRIMTCYAKQGQIVEVNRRRSSECLARVRGRLGEKSALCGIAWQRRGQHTITRTARGLAGWNGGWVTPKIDWALYWRNCWELLLLFRSSFRFLGLVVDFNDVGARSRDSSFCVLTILNVLNQGCNHLNLASSGCTISM